MKNLLKNVLFVLLAFVSEGTIQAQSYTGVPVFLFPVDNYLVNDNDDDFFTEKHDPRRSVSNQMLPLDVYYDSEVSKVYIVATGSDVSYTFRIKSSDGSVLLSESNVLYEGEVAVISLSSVIIDDCTIELVVGDILYTGQF